MVGRTRQSVPLNRTGRIPPSRPTGTPHRDRRLTQRLGGRRRTPWPSRSVSSAWARSVRPSTASSSPTHAPSVTVGVIEGMSASTTPSSSLSLHRGRLRACPALAVGGRSAQRACARPAPQDRRLAEVQGRTRPGAALRGAGDQGGQARRLQRGPQGGARRHRARRGERQAAAQEGRPGVRGPDAREDEAATEEPAAKKAAAAKKAEPAAKEDEGRATKEGRACRATKKAEPVATDEPAPTPADETPEVAAAAAEESADKATDAEKKSED